MPAPGRARSGGETGRLRAGAVRLALATAVVKTEGSGTEPWYGLAFHICPYMRML